MSPGYVRRGDSVVLKTLAFLTCAIVVCSTSYAQPKQESAARNQPADGEKAGTSKNPIVIEVLPPRDAEDRAKAEQEDRDAKRKTDDELARFTGQLAEYTKDLAGYTGVLVALGIGQILIFIAQLIFVWRQERMARRHERAYVHGAVSEKFREPITGFEGQVLGWRARIEAHNTGRTSASIKEVWWAVRSLEGLPQEPKYIGRSTAYLPLAPQDKWSTKAEFTVDFTTGKEQVLFAMLVYEDVFKDTHRARFIIKVQLGIDRETQTAIATYEPVEGFPKYLEWD